MASRKALLLVGVLFSVFATANTPTFDYQKLLQLQGDIRAVCPVRWEPYLTPISYQTGDSLWQNNLLDKAAFVKYASVNLKDQDGSFKLSSFSDDGAVILTCGRLKQEYFEMLRLDDVAISNAFNAATLIDSDGDGVNNALDMCADSDPAETPAGLSFSVNAVGCTPWQADSDGDGVTDHIDLCADTVQGAIVDTSDGCVDSDLDGFSDRVDQCADTAAGAATDGNGCSAIQLDFDLDCIANEVDEYPHQAATVNQCPN